MKQVLFGGVNLTPSTSNVRYNTIAGGASWIGEFGRSQLISTSGKISHLFVVLNLAPGSGKSYTFTLRVNKSDSDLTCSISDSETSGADTTHEVSVSAGDSVSLQCTPSGTPVARYADWTMIFTGDVAKESLLLSRGYLPASSNWYAPLTQSEAWSGITAEDDARQICSANGTLKNLYVELGVSPGTPPDAYTFTVRKNGVSTSLSCTIAAPNITGHDTVNSVSVSQGDILTLEIEPYSNPPASAWTCSFGLTFVAYTDGESLILGGSSNDLHSGNTEFNELWSADFNGSWSFSEGSAIKIGQDCSLKNLYIKLSGTPGSGKSYTFTVRKNGADTALTCSIADTDTTGNDTINEVSVVDGDEVTLKVVPSGTPTVRDAYWGVTQYILPAPPPTAQRSYIDPILALLLEET